MSWLSDIADSVSGLFGSGTSGIGPVADGAKYAEMLRTGSSGSSGFGFKDILDYGLPLAGTYFQQSQGKSAAEAYAQQAANEIAANKEMLDKKLAADLEAARISAGASGASARISAEAQRKNTLANLYSNWANLANKAGSDKAEQASRTGQMMNEGAVARARVLI
jgi:hypothetical protein